MYPVLLTITLLLVAGSSAYMSVYGLMSVFSNTQRIIMCMGLGMEIGKILIVSYLYLNWQKLNRLTRVLYFLILSVLVLLTSIEILGFLSQSHSSSTRDLMITRATIIALEKEENLLKGQMSVIDTTLEGLPSGYVTRRIKERKASGYDEKQERLLKIAKEHAQLAKRIILERECAGPVFAAARIMKINESDAIALFILFLVSVLEPLSIGLTVAASAAWTRQRIVPEMKLKPDTSIGEINEIQDKYHLTADQLAKITGRKKTKTCQAWLNGTTPVPPRALKAVEKWVEKQTNT